MINELEINFRAWLSAKGLHCSDQQLAQFDQYFQKLIAWNEKINLTNITNRDDVYIKHFYDSLSLAFYVPLLEVQSIADIGSGAGFPSIPLKILFPHLRVTIIDSLNKRILFLNDLVESLQLSDVVCHHGRAEDAARLPAFRDHFDLVTARAVAKLNVLNELCLPFVTKNGLFVAMKGSDPGDEIASSERSLTELKGKIKEIHSLILPVEQSTRHLIVIQKQNEITPKKYPRKPGIPARTPLG